MKVMSVFLFILILMMLVNVSLDLAVGLSLTNSFRNLTNPFWVMEKGEYVIFIIFIVLTVAQQIFFFRKKTN